MILYQDADILLVNKPVGILAQADATDGDSLPKRLKNMGINVKPVHRLDRATGGVMVYALTDKSAAILSETVRDHTKFAKDYLAIICGKPDATHGVLEDLLYHDVHKNKSYVVKRVRGGVKRASLDYTVLNTVITDNRTYSLVRVRLHTGRTHQIRVQFASRKWPLAGDSRYGGTRDCPLALWSYQLTLPHPTTQDAIHATSLPDATTFPWKLFDMSML